MSVYKYMSFSNLKFLLEGTIRFTQPKAFNDPFELLPELYLEGNIDGVELNLIAESREQFPARLPDDFESTYCNDFTARDLLSAISDLVGILCLSKNPNSLLMWSHYSDEYKGAVVEFDESHEFFTGLIPIQYEPHRPKLDFQLLIDSDGYLRISELCYKPEDWAYENEHRIIRNLSDCKKKGKFNGFDIYTTEVPLDCIKSITLGERMPVENQRHVMGKIYNTHIGLSLAAISNWGYGFRSDPIKFDKPLTEISPMLSPRTAHIFKDLKGNIGEMARWMIEEHPMADIANKTL